MVYERALTWPGKMEFFRTCMKKTPIACALGVS